MATDITLLLALEPRATIALTIFGVLTLLGGLLYLTARGELRGKRKALVPAAMRPAPSDEDLERRVLERYLVVGAVTVLFMGVFLPIYWLREPARMEDARAAFVSREIEEGGHLYEEFCATCHGRDGEGLPRQVSVAGEQLQVEEPPLAFAYARYRAAGRSQEEITELIYQAIAHGRPGTVMPTWLLAYGGGLNSYQVENLILYLQSIQRDFPEVDDDATGAELFATNCAGCHGPNADGVGGVGPNLQVAFERHTREDIHDVISYGRLNTNRYSMPPWAVLGDDALDKLVSYVFSIQGGRP